MGEKKHSKGSAFGKAKLNELAAEVYEGDGCRFDKDGPRIAHKSLPKHPKYRERYQPQYELGY